MPGLNADRSSTSRRYGPIKSQRPCLPIPTTGIAADFNSSSNVPRSYSVNNATSNRALSRFLASRESWTSAPPTSKDLAKNATRVLFASPVCLPGVLALSVLIPLFLYFLGAPGDLFQKLSVYGDQIRQNPGDSDDKSHAHQH